MLMDVTNTIVSSDAVKKELKKKVKQRSPKR